MSDSEDDYLFDGSGAPDADVERLERVLRPIGRRDDAPIAPRTSRPPLTAIRLIVGALVASAAAVLVGATLRRDDVASPTVAPTSVASGPSIHDARNAAVFAVGEWVETTDADREILVGELGDVRLRANSRLQVRRVTDETTRLYLERGSLEAKVAANARPRFFQVDTDAARCVDLGCRYTLDVAPDGVATVRVTTGQVAFESGTREVFVPAGAVCVARKGSGPGTPRFEDARASVVAAFDAYDAEATAPVERRRELARVALDAVASDHDTLPAWHLLQDADADVVRDAAARLAVIAGPCELPANPSRSDVREAWKRRLEPRRW